MDINVEHLESKYEDEDDEHNDSLRRKRISKRVYGGQPNFKGGKPNRQQREVSGP